MNPFRFLKRIDETLLGLATALMATVHRKYGLSPVRQIPLFVVLGSALEMVVAAFVAAVGLTVEAPELAMLALVALLSISFDGAAAWAKLKSSPKTYGPRERAAAQAAAFEDRTIFSIFLRMSIWAAVAAFTGFAAMATWPFGLFFLAAAVYFAVYGSRFFFRACDMPPLEAQVTKAS